MTLPGWNQLNWWQKHCAVTVCFLLIVFCVIGLLATSIASATSQTELIALRPYTLWAIPFTIVVAITLLARLNNRLTLRRGSLFRREAG